MNGRELAGKIVGCCRRFASLSVRFTPENAIGHDGLMMRHQPSAKTLQPSRFERPRARGTGIPSHPPSSRHVISKLLVKRKIPPFRAVGSSAYCRLRYRPLEKRAGARHNRKHQPFRLLFQAQEALHPRLQLEIHLVLPRNMPVWRPPKSVSREVVRRCNRGTGEEAFPPCGEDSANNHFQHGAHVGEA